MIDLAHEHLSEVKAILEAHLLKARVVAFGSRAKGTSWTYSDLDLAIKSDTPIDWEQIEALKDAFSESDLPFIVDLIDLSTVDSSFAAIVEKEQVHLF